MYKLYIFGLCCFREGIVLDDVNMCYKFDLIIDCMWFIYIMIFFIFFVMKLFFLEFYWIIYIKKLNCICELLDVRGVVGFWMMGGLGWGGWGWSGVFFLYRMEWVF